MSFQRGQPLRDGGALLHSIDLSDPIDRIGVGAGKAHAPGAGHSAIKGLFGRVHFLLGRAVGMARAVATARALPPRDQVGPQRVFHLTLTGAERGKAALEPLLLKASAHFIDLRRELVDAENRITASRRFYNLAVEEYATTLRQFPGSYIGRLSKMSMRMPFDLGVERVLIDEPLALKF